MVKYRLLLEWEETVPGKLLIISPKTGLMELMEFFQLHLIIINHPRKVYIIISKLLPALHLFL